MLIIVGKNPDFYNLHPNFGKFHDIPCFTADSIFNIQFGVFCIVDIMAPRLSNITAVTLSSFLRWTFPLRTEFCSCLEGTSFIFISVFLSCWKQFSHNRQQSDAWDQTELSDSRWKRELPEPRQPPAEELQSQLPRVHPDLKTAPDSESGFVFVLFTSTCTCVEGNEGDRSEVGRHRRSFSDSALWWM